MHLVGPYYASRPTPLHSYLLFTSVSRPQLMSFPLSHKYISSVAVSMERHLAHETAAPNLYTKHNLPLICSHMAMRFAWQRYHLRGPSVCRYSGISVEH
jgi:hypothetical protein